MTKSDLRNLLKFLIFLLFIFLVVDGYFSQNVKYRREDYKHWIDGDSDCQNTRQEVLIAESLVKVELDESGCRVVQGKWYDPYSNQYFTDPKELDIDHFVPLKEAHRSGAQNWSAQEKMRYANDVEDEKTLIAVSRSANRAKGDKDPSDWMPENKNYHCEYIKNWVLIKQRWQLEMDEKEKDFVTKFSQDCEKNLQERLVKSRGPSLLK